MILNEIFESLYNAGDSRNLERIEKKLAGDVGYMPDRCDGHDCPYFADCTTNSEDYDICPLLDPTGR